MVTLMIDGRQVSVEPGTTVLEAVGRCGFTSPTGPAAARPETTVLEAAAAATCAAGARTTRSGSYKPW